MRSLRCVLRGCIRALRSCRCVLGAAFVALSGAAWFGPAFSMLRCSLRSGMAWPEGRQFRQTKPAMVAKGSIDGASTVVRAIHQVRSPRRRRPKALHIALSSGASTPDELARSRRAMAGRRAQMEEPLAIMAGCVWRFGDPLTTYGWGVPPGAKVTMLERQAQRTSGPSRTATRPSRRCASPSCCPPPRCSTSLAGHRRAWSSGGASRARGTWHEHA